MDHALFDVACALSNVELAKQQKEVFLASKRVQRNPDDKHHRWVKLDMDARIAMLEKKWEKALGSFASFLDVDLSTWGKKDPELLAYANGTERLARSYRDAGIAQYSLGKTSGARKTWRRGMACRDDAANGPYKQDIAKLLQEC